MARKTKKGKGSKKRAIPNLLPLELSTFYRIVFSERQFVHIDGDHLVISFLSRDRRYSGSTVEPTPDAQGFRPLGPADETNVEIEV